MGSKSRPTGAQWRKSSYSIDTGGSCVEVAESLCATTPSIGIRDSKNPAGPHLTLGPAAFTTFLDWTATTAR